MQVELPVRHPAQIEQIVHEPRLKFEIAAHHGHFIFQVHRQVRAVLHRDDRHYHRPERRSEFVADRREEAVLGQIGGLGLGQRLSDCDPRLVEGGGE